MKTLKNTLALLIAIIGSHQAQASDWREYIIHQDQLTSATPLTMNYQIRASFLPDSIVPTYGLLEGGIEATHLYLEVPMQEDPQNQCPAVELFTGESASGILARNLILKPDLQRRICWVRVDSLNTEWVMIPEGKVLSHRPTFFIRTGRHPETQTLRISDGSLTHEFQFRLSDSL